ncbi:MAG: GNAT family N-acetyltransferase [Planctomycetaceae bacterium]
MLSYAWRVQRSVAEINQAEWRQACGAPADPTLDVRFLLAVERAFAEDAEFWYATFFDDSGRPIGCACFSLYRVDGALFAPPVVQRLTQSVRRFWKRFCRFKILLCGLPVSTCGCQLAVSVEANLDRFAASLDELAQRLARESGSNLISFKEFPPALADRLKVLERHEYRRAHSVVAYQLEGEFESFANYYDSRSKRTRANIRRHFRKLEEAGLTWEHFRGGDSVAQMFTDDVHRLYLNVLNRAEMKFECNPAEFFREVARQFPEEASFTFIRQGTRIVGFCCGFASPGQHTLLFCGLEYALNSESDLYFNLIYRGLEQALAPGVRIVRIGASADEFKQHMGCRPTNLSIYVKAVGAVSSFVFNRVFGLLFDAEAPRQAATPRPGLRIDPAHDGPPPSLRLPAREDADAASENADHCTAASALRHCA